MDQIKLCKSNIDLDHSLINTEYNLAINECMHAVGVLPITYVYGNTTQESRSKSYMAMR